MHKAKLYIVSVPLQSNAHSSSLISDSYFHLVKVCSHKLEKILRNLLLMLILVYKSYRTLGGELINKWVVISVKKTNTLSLFFSGNT